VSLRIDSVSIENLKGIEKLDFQLGSLTVLSGANGTGKSSVIDAISSVFDGGHDPGLIRLGAESGRVTLTLSNGTTIRKTINQKTSRLDITTKDGLKVTKPAAFIEKLASGFSFDPLSFLAAPPRERAAFLLEAMPVMFPPDEIAAATGAAPPSRPLNIEELGQLRLGIYEKRREVNVQAKEAEALAASLRSSLPGDDGEDWPAKVAILAALREALTKDLAAKEAAIKDEAAAQRAGAHAKMTAAVEEARKVFELARNAAADEYQSACSEIDRLSSEMLSSESAMVSAELQTVAGELATAEEKRRAQDRSIDVRRQLENVGDRAAKLNMEAYRLTTAIEKLDALKAAALARMPIPGVEIQDGKILVNGIELDQVNTQQQYFLAFQLASLRQGDLGFMVCDRAESIVGAEWEEFQAAARESGFQVLVARSVPHEELRAQEVA
jgi:chromosome segregation ATPase